MDIKKADSKGRVSGFDPGYYYAIDRETGQFMRMAILAPDGRPVEEALRRDMNTYVAGPISETMLKVLSEGG